MPLRHSPPTLRKAAIVALGNNWDLFCYGCRSSMEMNTLLENDGFLQFVGPFTHLRTQIRLLQLPCVGMLNS